MTSYLKSLHLDMKNNKLYLFDVFYQNEQKEQSWK